MVIKTKGLPDGKGNPDRIYEFNIDKKHISIPGYYYGRDMMGEPYFPEQKMWLINLPPLINIKEVWYGWFECATDEDISKLIAILEPIAIKEL
ncbi:hypothetical protein [Raineya sp.]|jgi:hypothetical protein